MTLASTPPLIDYVEDGATLVHAIPFQFNDAGEIACSRIPAGGGTEVMLTRGSDFTVAGGGGSAGSLTKAAGGTAGGIFRIRRETQETQATAFLSTGVFPAKNVEAGLDRSMAVAQETAVGLQLLEQRSLRGWAGEMLGMIPQKAQRALKLLSFDYLGNPVATDPNTITGGKGDPGGNVMAIGLFTEASTLAIPPGTDMVETSGYAARGIGNARYVADAAVDAAYVAANPYSSFISADGRGFRIGGNQTVTPFMWGCVGDGVTNDYAAFQAFNDWFFAELRVEYGDFTGEFGCLPMPSLGPAVATGNQGLRYNVGGHLRILALAPAAEVVVLRNLGETHWAGIIDGVGQGGPFYATRTCFIGIKVVNCAQAQFGGLRAYNCQYHGVYFPSTGTKFNDNIAVGLLETYNCGSDPVDPNYALSGNWSAVTKDDDQAGSYGQQMTFTVDTLPPELIDDYEGWGHNQVYVTIGGELRGVVAVDRDASTISVYPWFSSTAIAAGSGTFSYIFGASASGFSGDAGLINITQLHAVSCGIGLSMMALYGWNIETATTEYCGAGVALAADPFQSKVGGRIGNYFGEAHLFDLVLGSVSDTASAVLDAMQLLDFAKVVQLIDPLNADDTRAGSGGSLGDSGSLAQIKVNYLGRDFDWHQRPIEAQETGFIPFRDHQRPASVYTRNGNGATIALMNMSNGAVHKLFGYRGAVWNFIGTGSNFAPTGTFTFAPPTKAVSCTTANGDATVTTADTRMLAAGMPVAGTGVPAGATVLSVTDRTHFELSANATASGTDALTFTGSVNGTFANVDFSGFSTVAAFTIVQNDTYEMQWVVSCPGASGGGGPAATAVRGDETVTIGAGDPATQMWNEPLTATRVAEFAVVGVADGQSFNILRTAAASGASPLALSSGGTDIKDLNANEWARCTYFADLAAWVVVAWGTLA